MADVAPRDRGVSTVVGYVLNIAIATALITGLIFAAGTLVTDQRERAVQSEFDVVGNRIAADLATTDRLVRASDGGEVTVRSTLPSVISGQQYQVHIQPDGDSVAIVLSTDRPDVSVRVPLNNSTRVSETTFSGGDLVFRASGDGPIEVDNG